MIAAGRRSLGEYKGYLMGVEINSTDAVLHYTTTIRHTAPVALNLLTNVLALSYAPSGSGDTVHVINHPLAGSLDLRQLAAKEPKTTDSFLAWALFIVVSEYCIIIIIIYPRKLQIRKLVC